MRTTTRPLRLLGAAFLIQAIASAAGGLLLLEPLPGAGDMAVTMTKVAANPLQARASILVEMITVMGVIMLGAMLYSTLKPQHPALALFALGLYIAEATTLAVSQQAAPGGDAGQWRAMGELLVARQSFGYDLHMLLFGLGATLFYGLLHRSRLVPRGLSVWGLSPHRWR